MNKEEFKERMLKIDKDRIRAVSALNNDYAMANNKVNFGDTVTDHQYTICVDSIVYEVSYSTGFPECIYSGYRLKRSGVRFKNEAYESVYQCNVVAHAPAQKQVEE